ncbi:uncharacterized protein LOC119835706 [Zerene cesonia]|uniref:uncharacterized protein LOC119835706 n=1 Tax=Zerene cesonia TaxID=33412 RepID=UPI0018E5751B|nr:uncharacterized protein LOC119835706 [Zerene cesonia]
MEQHLNGKSKSQLDLSNVDSSERILDSDQHNELERGVEARVLTKRGETSVGMPGPSGLSAATSVDSLMTVQSFEEDRLWAKRKRSSGASCSGSSTEEGHTRSRRNAPKRGRGRPQSAASNMASARKTLADMATARKALTFSREEPKLGAERVTRQVTRSLRASRVAESGDGQTDEECTAALRRRVDDSLSAIEQRSASEEARQLQSYNTRLQAEIEGLRKEVGELRATLRSVQPTQTDSDLTANIMRQVGDMLSARFETLEERLLPKRRVRPPLAADSRAEGMAVDQASTEDFPPLPPSKAPAKAPGKATAPTPAKKKNAAIQQAKPGPAPKASGKGKGKTAQRPASNMAANESVPSTSSVPQQQQLEQGWTIVERKKGGGKKKKGPAHKRRKARKLRAPSSSAVVITLQQGAEERGVTYASVMAGSREKVDLAEIGVKEMRFRRAATGARILEIPGVTSSREADALAAKLREIWDEDTVKVSRPVKCAEVQVTGLDDSAAVGDIVAAISRAGECPVEQVKSSGLRIGPRGSTTAWENCPVAAAKRVAKVGRVLVGYRRKSR